MLDPDLLKSSYPLLSTLHSPEDLRALPQEDMQAVADELRRFMIESVSKTGGHLSSPLGAIELTVALHRVFQTPQDNLIWDVGHQAYAHKMLTGRLNQMDSLRMFEGLSGFPKRAESPYDAFGTGHSSTSISAALGMAVGHYLKGERDRWSIAVIGDGALTGGMALEALNDAGAYKEGVKLLVILNDNDWSISRPVGALSRHLAKIVSTKGFNCAREIAKRTLRPLPWLWDFFKRAEKQTINFMSPASSIFSAYDINYYGPIDGHDMHALLSVLENLKTQQDCPIVLHVVTKKGKGYAFAEADPTRYHGVGAFDPAQGIVSGGSDGKPTYTQVFSQWICDTAERDPLLYAITPAMREGSGLVEFEKRFPTRYRDVAIAEQHAVTYAAGIACEGIRPVVAIYSTFLQRALDQVIHDVALQNLPVTFAIDRGGLVGADGATHQGFFDLALLRAIPNMIVSAPSNENECRLLLNTAYASQRPAAVRYPRGKGPGVAVTATTETVEIGKAKCLRRGQGICFMGFGTMTNVLDKVATSLDGTLLDMRFVKPIDEAAIVDAARQHTLLVVAEEGVLMGGAGSAVLECLAKHDLQVDVMTFGLPDDFVEQGTQNQLLASLGLTSEAIEAKVRARWAKLQG